MQNKLKELTEKIYHEGVEKANNEAEKILTEAKNQADDTLAKAKKDAASILNKAEKDADDLKKNALNELQLAARQAISDVKQQIVNLVEAKTIKPETKAAFKEAAFTKNIIRSIVDKWNPDSGDNVDLEVLLPASMKKEFEAYYETKTKNLLSGGLDVDFSERIKGGFQIGPKDGGYLISFTDEDFTNFFKAYMRPRLINMLFEEQDKEGF